MLTATDIAYRFHGLQLTLAGEPSLLEALQSRLALLPAGDRPVDDLRFEFHLGVPPDSERPNGAAREIYQPEQGSVVYEPDTDRVCMSFGDRIHAVCEPATGLTRTWIDSPTTADRWLLSHPILTLPLLEILKRRGLYSLHAAGLSRHGQALVVVGASGSGKTTLALALARAGFDFMGDDMLFLADRPEGIGLHAFPDEVDVTEGTICFFPELARLLEAPRPIGWRKWSFRAESFYDAPVAWTARPAAIVFPRISHVTTSALEPMSAADALLEVLPNVLLTDSRACQAHLSALARLTSETPCYRLSTGRDFEQLPGMLKGLLP